MSVLFQKTRINGLDLPNRLIRSATWEGMCEPDGRPTERLCRAMEDLARGGVGLIVSGYSYVRPDGRQNSGQMGICTDAPADVFKQMTRRVHDSGGKIIVQLVHAGGQARPADPDRRPLAPTAVQADQYGGEIPDELSPADIGAIADAFAWAAGRARAWGFDGVQLHGAHGYLINQFLSPLTNLRTDDYGGSIENRSRFLLDVYRNVRSEVGRDYPVMVKLNATDHLDGGLQLDDALYAARRLDEAGIDAIEVSSGTIASRGKSPVRVRINAPHKEAYNLAAAQQLKTRVKCPVIAVGGFRTFEVAENAVATGLDYISMSRPLIREPDLPARWQRGDRRPAACISCNGCFKPGIEEGGIYCVQEKKTNRKGE